MAIGPLSWPLLLQSVRRHLAFFFILFSLGLSFAAVGGGMLWFADSGDGGVMFGGGLFALIGIGIIITAVVTNFSSIGYYYERALLRKYGANVDGEVLGVTQYNEPENEEEVLWLLRFRYAYVGRCHEGEAFLPDEKWLSQFGVGDWVPLRVLKPRPKYAEPRWRKWKKQLQRAGRWQAGPGEADSRPAGGG